MCYGLAMRVSAKQKSSRKAVRGRAAAVAPADSRRRTIVDHAIRLMEEKGFAAVSVQHMADALEFSKANFYHHVDSKERLLYEIFVEHLQFAFRHIEEIVGRDAPIAERFRALIEFYVSMMTERRAVMLVWFKEKAHLTEPHLAEVSELERQITSRLNEFYSSGIAAGQLKPLDPDVIRLAVFGMCFQFTRLPATVDRARIAVITAQLQELVTTGLLSGRS
jgi:TetR/AcrR family transcriptional regulator, cholesterol catabolism regulator